MQENLSLEELKSEQIAKIKDRNQKDILESENAQFLIRLIEEAKSKSDVLKLSSLGMSLKRTGFHFDVRLEKEDRTVKYLAKDENLSFVNDENRPTHKLIIGDNYPALLNLLITHKGKIKVIYIDPPYSKDDLGNFAKTNYDNAITRDNLLSMLKPRLELAKMLLRDDGVIFCSIDDKNQAYVKCLFDEVFGEGNFCGNIIWLKGNAQNDADTIQKNQEYILCYAKNIESKPINQILQKEKVKAFKDSKTGKFYYEGSGFVSGNANSDLNHHSLCGFTIFYNATTNDIQHFMDYDTEKAKFSNDEQEIYKEIDKNLLAKGYGAIRPPKKGNLLGRWVVSFEKFAEFIKENQILIKKGKNGYSVLRKEWLDSKKVKQDEKGEYYAIIEKKNPPKSFIDFASSGSGIAELKDVLNDKVFDNPKNLKLLKHLLKISTNGGGGSPLQIA